MVVGAHAWAERNGIDVDRWAIQDIYDRLDRVPMVPAGEPDWQMLAVLATRLPTDTPPVEPVGPDVDTTYRVSKLSPSIGDDLSGRWCAGRTWSGKRGTTYGGGGPLLFGPPQRLGRVTFHTSDLAIAELIYAMTGKTNAPQETGVLKQLATETGNGFEWTEAQVLDACHNDVQLAMFA